MYIFEYCSLVRPQIGRIITNLFQGWVKYFEIIRTNKFVFMLYSHNVENEKINLFTLFLDKAKQGDAKYAQIVNEVILETHLYVVGKKDLYNINRDSINIILLLAQLAKDYFASLKENTSEYNNEIYTKVSQAITTKAELV